MSVTGDCPRVAIEMYDAVCADCGSACQVPFQPTQGRPVYCSGCFSKHKPTGPRR